MIYFSENISQELPLFFKKLGKTLVDNEINFDLLKGTKDIWCKDWMPIPVSNGAFVKFKYDPDYLKGVDEQPKPNVNNLTKQLRISVEEKDIVLSGSNIVRKGQKGILTEKIFQENRELSRDSIISQIKNALGLNEIIIIPQEPQDFLGNADNMVRFINEDTLFINDYSFFDEEFSKGITSKIKAHGLEMVKLPYLPEQKITNELYTALGNYINFLEVGNKVIMPTFGLESDRVAFQIIQRSFPNKEVVPLSSIDLAMKGGVLNNVTWSDRYAIN